MEMFIVVRHATRVQRGSEEYAEQELTRLCVSLKPQLDQKSVRILSSPEVWGAVRTAEYLATTFGVEEVEKHEILDDRIPSSRDIDQAIDLVLERGKDVDVLLVVTHHRYTSPLPARFCERVLREREYVQGLDTAEAWVVDCEKRVLFRLPKPGWS